MEKYFLSVRQGRYLLQAELLNEESRPLSAAINGEMSRVIHERPMRARTLPPL